ncbi:type I-B CRISPR-associated protein Cas7/Cst2/DevR [Agrilactobacillus fermenti]|uniref:type I-B CRISPR-associated protein Cas7/Cst2/DevR n=1 Tax=Agrilactobacillus fermenti TaxID=2586909 RepID=UPI003A5C3BCC
MAIKGLTATIIFEAESANYGESMGNFSLLKKMTREDGNQCTYISRQALRYNIVDQLGETPAKLTNAGSGNKTVIQFAPEATIKDYPELDFFGYLKTEKSKNGDVRSAKVRLSNAISLETYKGDTDFLTNMGLAARMRKQENDPNIFNSIAQAEIHHAYYRYTVTIDLDQIGIDLNNEENNIDNQEKSRRVQKLLDTIAFLYRDIRGRREDLKPLFIIGGVYDLKNPIFENVVTLKDDSIQIAPITEAMNQEIKANTAVGIVADKFGNSDDVKRELGARSVLDAFDTLKTKVADYYEGH